MVRHPRLVHLSNIFTRHLHITSCSSPRRRLSLLHQPRSLRIIHSNSFGSNSSIQLSEASNDSSDWSAPMEMFGNPRTDDTFGPCDPGWFDIPGTSTTSVAAVRSTNSILTDFPSASAPASATAGRAVANNFLFGLDGLTSYDTTFNAGLPVLPEWGNYLGLEISDGQELKF